MVWLLVVKVLLLLLHCIPSECYPLEGYKYYLPTQFHEGPLFIIPFEGSTTVFLVSTGTSIYRYDTETDSVTLWYQSDMFVVNMLEVNGTIYLLNSRFIRTLHSNGTEIEVAWCGRGIGVNSNCSDDSFYIATSMVVSNETLYVVDKINVRINVIHIPSKTFSFLPVVNPYFVPVDICKSSDPSYFWVILNGVIQKFYLNGTSTVVVGGSSNGCQDNQVGTSAEVSTGTQGCIEWDGFVYFIDNGCGKLRRFSVMPPYPVDTVAGTGELMKCPSGVSPMPYYNTTLYNHENLILVNGTLFSPEYACLRIAAFSPHYYSPPPSNCEGHISGSSFMCKGGQWTLSSSQSVVSFNITNGRATLQRGFSILFLNIINSSVIVNGTITGVSCLLSVSGSLIADGLNMRESVLSIDQPSQADIRIANLKLTNSTILLHLKPPFPPEQLLIKTEGSPALDNLSLIMLDPPQCVSPQLVVRDHSLAVLFSNSCEGSSSLTVAIIGGVVGGVAGVAAIIAVILTWRRKTEIAKSFHQVRTKTKERNTLSPPPTTTTTPSTQPPPTPAES